MLNTIQKLTIEQIKELKDTDDRHIEVFHQDQRGYIILAKDLVDGLCLMGYLYDNGTFYQLDTGRKLWLPIKSDKETPEGYMSRVIIELFNAFAEDVQFDGLLGSKTIRDILDNFKGTYNRKWLGARRIEWIEGAHKNLNESEQRREAIVQELQSKGLASDMIDNDETIVSLDNKISDCKLIIAYEGIQERIDNRDRIAVVKNGFIDISKRYNKDLMPNSEYLFVTECCDVMYSDIPQPDMYPLPYPLGEDPETKKPLYVIYDELLKSVIGDDDALEVLLCYYAIPTFRLPHVDKLVFVYGVPNSGKTTALITTIFKILSSRCGTTNFTDFMHERFGLAPFQDHDLLILDDKVAPESKAARKQLGENIKAATNNGQIRIEEKYQKAKDIENRTQMIIVNNYPSVFGEMSPSVRKRLIVFKCDKFQDTSIKEVREILQSERAANWLFNRMLNLLYTVMFDKSFLTLVDECDYLTNANRELYSYNGGRVVSYIDQIVACDPEDVGAIRSYFLSPKHCDVNAEEDRFRTYCSYELNEPPERNELRNWLTTNCLLVVDQRTVNGKHISSAFVDKRDPRKRK